MAVASGLEFGDWPTGLLRGFHPLRWLLCLVGLVLTGLSAIVARSVFDQRPPDLPGWWQQPVERAHALWAEIAVDSLGRIIVHGGALLALNTALWCLIGGWIARHELVARRQGRYGTAEVPVEPSATAFLIGWWKSLVACCPIIILGGVLMLMPVVLAGWVNAWFGGLGAVVVSLLLPVMLAANLVLLLLGGFGAVAWPLIPVAVAAECSDSFDAIGRSYSYASQRPVRFLLLTATALALAGLPLGVLHLFAEQMMAGQPGACQTVLLLAAALSASIFWSLETLVYLHLRSAVDAVDASEIAVEPPPRDTPKIPSPKGEAAEIPTSEDSGRAMGRSFLRRTIRLLAAGLGSWWLTFWLFTRASRGQTEWLGWGMSETFVPPAEGAYKVASMIAGLWGVAWLALPFLVRTVPYPLLGRAPQERRGQERN